MNNPNISAAAATEAAASVRDAFQPGNYPSVEAAYEFIREVWAANDDPRWRRLPVTPNHSFSAVYLGLIAR
ncbi:hypothetical protein [Pseudomonas sp.]|uniref:hypothetical protein n=1 Tax=Pseudomonas sp. TaxID=306 RepID=UPI00333F8A87